ncbi:hypothetical protein GCM10022217_05230 [Chryseobacterium ginsenosidimutans]|uniref:glycosyl hydrolase family 28-related protein n=1 Tax=Chryseobacterium ginsenosidimutans TaxID=687846 RepID=UPI0031DB031B
MKKILFCLIFILFSTYQNAQNLSNNFLSIKKFGGTGDGRTSDSDNLQKTIDFAEKNSIKTIIIPDGKYLLDKPLVFRKGGIQLIGTGALLREEGWAKTNKNFANDEPFIGCTFMISKNSTGIVFDKTVADPVRISNIQFLAKDGRTQGNTIAIKFQSEFNGPTWPFIVERCNFRGFNYAVKFESANQYNVAFVQFSQNAFSQNDECVYFSDLPNNEVTPAGGRNLTWGFTFQNNSCHDNSRVIRGAFSKDPVNILNNNMEGNIPYANGKMPPNIVDLEISHCTVNFEGNHFESVVSDCVSVSSAFKKNDGSYAEYSGKTTGSEKNKIFIKGNNFDGIKNFKPFILKSMMVYNYDAYNLYVDECDIRQNDSNILNEFLSDYAVSHGTTLKTATGKYESSYKVFNIFREVKSVKVKTSGTANILSPYSGLDFIKVNKSSSSFKNPSEYIYTNENDKLAGVSFIVNNPKISDFLGVVIFDVSEDNGQTYKQLYLSGTYGTNIGFSTITGFIPTNGKKLKIRASLITDVIGDTDIFVANNYTLFTIKETSQIPAIPVFEISNL